MASNPLVVPLSSLKPFFFKGLHSGGALLGPWWSRRPRNPIRAFPICISSTTARAECLWHIASDQYMSFTGSAFRLVLFGSCLITCPVFGVHYNSTIVQLQNK